MIFWIYLVWLNVIFIIIFLKKISKNVIVMNIRLIQPMVITLEGGWIGWWSFFVNLNYVNVRDNYIQVYNKQYKDNCI